MKTVLIILSVVASAAFAQEEELARVVPEMEKLQFAELKRKTSSALERFRIRPLPKKAEAQELWEQAEAQELWEQAEAQLTERMKLIHFTESLGEDIRFRGTDVLLGAKEDLSDEAFHNKIMRFYRDLQDEPIAVESNNGIKTEYIFRLKGGEWLMGRMTTDSLGRPEVDNPVRRDWLSWDGTVSKNSFHEVRKHLYLLSVLRLKAHEISQEIPKRDRAKILVFG